MSELLIMGCGYLGGRIGAIAHREGDFAKIYGTSRSLDKFPTLQSHAIHPVLVDVLIPETWTGLALPDTIIHCVGYDRKSGHSIQEVYVDGLRTFLRHLEESAWSGRIVFTSSTGVYGQTDGSWVDEESPAIPSQASGEACLEAENELRKRSARNGWSSIVVRLAGLYGPGRLTQKTAIVHGDPIVGDAHRWLNMIHIDDAARCVLGLSKLADAADLYLAADDCPVERGEYYATLARHLGAPPPRFTPIIEGSMAAGRESSNKRVSNLKIKDALDFTFEHPSIHSGIIASLGDDSGTPIA